MLNVLHLLPMNKLSGAERMVLQICQHKENVKSVVITGGADLAIVFQKEGIQTYDLNFSIKNLPWLTKQLNHIISQHYIHIIHAHDNIASLVAYLTKKRYELDIKVISHIHSCYPWLEGSGIYKKIDQWIRPKYDYNIVCGQTVYDYYIEHAAYFHKDKASILSNAIELSKLGGMPQSKIDEMRKKFNLSSEKTIIGYIGRIIELKGLIPFIEVLVHYKESFNDCQFLIVGSGDQEEEVKQLVYTSGLDELFVFTGFQSDVYPFYQLIDIFFLPSLYEGLPMVLLESIGSGVPTISMNVGSISEVITNKKNGYLISRENYQQFINYLIILKGDSELRAQFSKEGLKTIQSNYSMEKYTELLHRIYKSIV